MVQLPDTMLGDHLPGPPAHKYKQPDLQRRSDGRQGAGGDDLHEMIHVYVFIQGYQENSVNYGPCFRKEMRRINLAGRHNITVDHPVAETVVPRYTWQCSSCRKSRVTSKLVPICTGSGIRRDREAVLVSPYHPIPGRSRRRPKTGCDLRENRSCLNPL